MATRATSMWELGRCPGTPRARGAGAQQQQQPPIGSPRLVRPSAGAQRLSNIGRIALRDQQCQSLRHLLSGRLGPRTMAGIDGRLWPRFAEPLASTEPSEQLKQEIAAQNVNDCRSGLQEFSVHDLKRTIEQAAYGAGGKPPPIRKADPSRPHSARGGGSNRASSVPRAHPLSLRTPQGQRAGHGCGRDRASSPAPHGSEGLSRARNATSVPPQEVPSRETPLVNAAAVNSERGNQHPVTGVPLHNVNAQGYPTQARPSLEEPSHAQRVPLAGGMNRSSASPGRRTPRGITGSEVRSDAARPVSRGRSPPPEPRGSPEKREPTGVGARHPRTPQKSSGKTFTENEEPVDGVVVWTEMNEEGDAGERRMSNAGLGAIQVDGRGQVMQHWTTKLDSMSKDESRPNSQVQRGRLENRSLSLAARPIPPATLSSTPEQSQLDWGQLNEASRAALQQWIQGNIGGRHCQLSVEHSSDSMVIDHETPEVSDIRAPGLALNTLAGFQVDGSLVGNQSGGWIYKEVFSKTAGEVLQEALDAVAKQLGEPKIEQVSEIPADQLNLALRRLHLAAGKSGIAAVRGSLQSAAGPRAGEEQFRVQIWMELIRAQLEPPAMQNQQAAGSKDKKSKISLWDDGCVMRELQKDEGELSKESSDMPLDILRQQNSCIEEYVMRLVRRRDELRRVVKCAEERDSYFILGLDGPDCSEEDVKRAYRQLARKEHPDKAGIQNKKRFQVIQQAYSSVLRQRRGEEGDRKESTDSPASPRNANRPKTPQQITVAGTLAAEATPFAIKASEEADKMAACAQLSLKLTEESTEFNSMPKKKALRALREATERGIMHLHEAVTKLHQVSMATQEVAKRAEAAVDDLKEKSLNTVAGVGLQDRAAIVDDIAKSIGSNAELLCKLREATEATLRKVERTVPDSALEPQARGKQSEELANFVRIGVRLLSESLTRQAGALHRSADEAINAASKGVELTRSLYALDREVKKEQMRKAAREQGFEQPDEAQEDNPTAAPDGRFSPENEDYSAPNQGMNEEPRQSPKGSASNASNKPPQSPKGALRSAQKRVKERHVALRVKNLKFLSNLNDEVLRYQVRLRSLLDRSEGALLPEINTEQKFRVFELAGQVLESALADVSKALDRAAGAIGQKALDRVLGFAQALDHATELALPAEVRTQALRLAALIDADLLCQIIEGPFRRRLLALGSKARTDRGVPARSLCRAGSLGGGGPAAKAWEEMVRTVNTRIVRGIRTTVSPQKEGGNPQAGTEVWGAQSPTPDE